MPVNHITAVLILLTNVTWIGTVLSAEINLHTDNPTTMIGTDSIDYQFHGIKIGMRRKQVTDILLRSLEIIGERDEHNPARIYVYIRDDEGLKGPAILYLIWQANEAGLSQITFFQDSRSLLSQPFRRLLSTEAIDDTSRFKKEFLGYANRSRITLDAPSFGTKHVTYFYDEIGLQITHKKSTDGDEVVFALVPKK